MLDILDSWRTILDYYQGALSYSHPLLSTITLTLDWLSHKKGTSIASPCFIAADFDFKSLIRLMYHKDFKES